MKTLPPVVNFTAAKLTASTAELRSRLADTSNEAVTGRRSDLTAYLDGRIGGAMLTQKAVADISLEREGLILRSSRLETVQTSLAGMQDNASGLSVRLLSAVGAGDFASRAGIARDARAALEDSFSKLNVRHGERFLFAGDATSTQPFGEVADMLSDIQTIAATATDAADFAASIDTYFNTPTGGFQTNIYNGATTASDSDAVLGIDPAITEILAGLAVMAFSAENSTAPFIASSPDVLRASAETLSSGETKLTNLRADQGSLQGSVAGRMSALNEEETIVTLALNELTGRDQYEAAVELQELERNLEASYLLTSRLSNLSLLNYLR